MRKNGNIMFSVKDTVWLLGVAAALFISWGMMSQRVTAMERDMDRMETAIQLFTKMDCKVYTKEKEEYESIIQTQQRIIETMTEKIAKQGQTITNYRNENEKLKGILQEFSR